MIGRLTGTLLEEGADGTIVLDVRGVGYEVLVPPGALGRGAALRAHPEGEITLFVHTHVREDVLALYGFVTREDRIAFRVLIQVPNIGPKTALSVMGAMPASDLAIAIGRGDVAGLTKIPGIGKRTAERIVLELKDKLPAATAVTAVGAAPAPIAPPPSGNAEMVLRALVEMGFKPAEAERAVGQLGPGAKDAKLPELIRQALALLVR